MSDYPKRLIEVDLPIKRISAHARREKSIRHGHISTLHIWWARRPLAACRAVMCAALWPDPADPLCPEAFREAVKAQVKKWTENHLALLSPESFSGFLPFQKDRRKLDDPVALRGALLDWIADFANWDHATKPEYLETSRTLTQVAHESMGGIPGTRPLVVDPFAGGGAIPLEALRVGADAFANDLNPVAVLLNKVVLEYIPKYGQRLADEVRTWGQWIKEQAEKELATFYPANKLGLDAYLPQPDAVKRKSGGQWELTGVAAEMPIAYLWARTVVCEGPGCGAEVPLMRSLWLAKKNKRSVGLRLIPKLKEKRVDFEVVLNPRAKEVNEGTVRRGAATCPCCGYTTPVVSVRQQLKKRRGGAADARLIAVVCTVKTERRLVGSKKVEVFDEQGRFYRLPTAKDMEAVQKAADELERQKKAHTGPLSLVPDEPTPSNQGHRAVSSVVIYGMTIWEDMFTPRQALALTSLVRVVQQIEDEIEKKHKDGLGTAIQTCLGLLIDRQANTLTSLSRWHTTRVNIEGVYARQALPMVWDFCEANGFSDSSGSFGGALDWIVQVCEAEAHFSQIELQGNVECVSATNHPLPDDSSQCFFTDPPYYDAVPYADLADFFYVWQKRMLGKVHPELFRNFLTPKEEQAIVWHPGSVEEKEEYERKMQQAMSEGRRVLAPAGIGIVVFAHKSTVGWEAQLQSMVNAGWTVTGSWPIDTEMGTRLNAAGTASLASSVHLVCRPRENVQGATTAGQIGDWRDVLQALPVRIHEWMPRLAQEGVVGADAIFACLGPALEIFSRYSRVEKASGEQVTLREYLEHVWAAVSREALTMIFKGADATGFEEDARITAMWLWTLSTERNGNGKYGAGEEDEEDAGGNVKSSAGYALEFDAARKIAQGLGAHLEQLNRVVEVKGDHARLLPVSERTRYLFGKDQAETPGQKRVKKVQMDLFKTVEEIEEEGGWGEKEVLAHGQTVLDRVHQAMILFAAGRGEALRRFLVEDGVGRDERFWRLSQALSALYPPETDEKRWVDGLLARKKGLGF